MAEGRSVGRRVLETGDGLRAPCVGSGFETGGGGVFGVTERNVVLRRGGQVRFVKKRIS